MTTTHHLNETAIERELRFLERHIERLEILQRRYASLDDALFTGYPDEDRRIEIYNEQADLEIELVLLEACYDRKQKLENF